MARRSREAWEGDGRFWKFFVGLAAVGGLIVGATFAIGWLKRPGRAAPATAGPGIEAELAADTTLGFVAFEARDLPTQLASLFAMRSITDDVPGLAWLRDSQQRHAVFGFDPATAGGWAEIGVDPGAGLAVVVDERVGRAYEPDKSLTPGVMLAGITDRARLVHWLEERFGKKIAIGHDNGRSEVLSIERNHSLIGARGRHTALLGELSARTDESHSTVRDGFEAFLQPAKRALGETDAFRAAFRERRPREERAWSLAAYLAADGIERNARRIVMTASARATLDHYVGLFRALGIHAGPTALGLRLVTTPKGTSALQRIFKPDAPAPRFSLLVPPDWGGLRISVNLPNLWKGLDELCPPGSSEALIERRRSIESLVGRDWAGLSAVLSGHFLLAGDTRPFAHKRRSGPDEWFLAIGMRDRIAAQSWFGEIAARAKAIGLPRFIPTRIAGRPAWKAVLGDHALVVAIASDVALVAQSEVPIAAALQLDPSRSFARLEAARQLDGDVAMAGVMDMTSNVEMWAGNWQLDGFEVVRQTPVLGGSLRVDAEGLYSDSRGAAPTPLTGIASLGFGTYVAVEAFLRRSRDER